MDALALKKSAVRLTVNLLQPYTRCLTFHFIKDQMGFSVLVCSDFLSLLLCKCVYKDVVVCAFVALKPCLSLMPLVSFFFPFQLSAQYQHDVKACEIYACK